MRGVNDAAGYFLYNQANKSIGQRLEAAHYLSTAAALVELQDVVAGCRWVMADIIHIFQFICSHQATSACTVLNGS